MVVGGISARLQNWHTITSCTRAIEMLPLPCIYHAAWQGLSGRLDLVRWTYW